MLPNLVCDTIVVVTFNKFTWRRILAFLWAALFVPSVWIFVFAYIVAGDSGKMFSQIGPGDLFLLALLILPISLLAGAIGGFRNPLTSKMVFLPVPLVLVFALIATIAWRF
jgi:hypothetical protein